MKNKKTIILILIIILLLVLNTYAWFIFNSNVSLTIDTQVKSWAIEFRENEQILNEEFAIEIESIYPGMEEQTKNIVIENKGEVNAEIGYKITAIELFGERKSVGENCTEEELKKYIEGLPFVIDVQLDKDTLETGNGQANCKISLKWLFGEEDSNVLITEKDKIDTELGIKAYEFHKLPGNEGVPSLKIEMQLFATQKNN